MQARRLFERTSWALVDQAVVSLGNFAVNILLARQLPLAEYGAFALVLSAAFALQTFNASLIFYPVSMRLAMSDERERPALLATGIVMTAAACVPLGLILSLALGLLGRVDLIAPALAFFVSWQLQQALRRNLAALFRFREAAFSDAISCLGPVAAFALIAAIDLRLALYALAAASAVAAVLQLYQLRLSFQAFAAPLQMAKEFWATGRWLLVENLATQMRLQVCPWTLAAVMGASATGAFQAASNISYLMNPLVLALCGVIPQTAAQSLSNGVPQAWMASRAYFLLAVLPVLSILGAALLAPALLLSLFYGSASHFVELTLPVQLLVLSAAIGCFADLIGSFLSGILAARLAFVVSAVGAAVAVILVGPMTVALGLTGACLASLAANAARLAAGQRILSPMISGNGRANV